MLNVKPKTVVLDLDQTLVYATPISEHETVKNEGFYIHDTLGLSFVRKRKHLDHFINTLIENGKNIIVWSAGSTNYVKIVCDVLFGRNTLHYILTRPHYDHCGGKKDLGLLLKHDVVKDFKIEESVLIDDIESNGSDNPRNIIVVKPFQGEEDDELLRVLKRIL